MSNLLKCYIRIVLTVDRPGPISEFQKPDSVHLSQSGYHTLYSFRKVSRKPFLTEYTGL